MKTFSFIFLTVFLSSVSNAQQSSYAGEELRAIKSLSEKEIEQYQSGAGMGLAKAAELNQYPGPRHVLELADTLNLSSDTKKKLELIFKSMKSDAILLGNKIVEKEQLLNSTFASGAITNLQLEQLTNEIGVLQAQLRYVHLRTHVTTKDLLTGHQIHLYDILRGYSSENKHHH